MSRMFSTKSASSGRSWSIVRRLFLIIFLLISSQALISIAVSTQLRAAFLINYLEQKLERQIIGPLNLISERLDQLTEVEAIRCCSLEDYRSFLPGILPGDEKTFLIAGSAGFQALQGTYAFYSNKELERYSRLAIASNTGFAVVTDGVVNPIAVMAVKLSGGPQTGHLVYIRPVYEMPLIRQLARTKLLSELMMMLSLSAFLLVALWLIFRPVRRIKEDIASIQLNHLDSAELTVSGRPTELQPILVEFNKMIERLRQSALNQKQFASTISHEFRTPLTVISGFIQSVLKRAIDLDKSFKDSLLIANGETLRLNRMLSDLLDLSRLDNNQLMVRQEIIDVKQSCDQALRLSRKAFPNLIKDNLDQVSLVFARGDSDRLVQCLENLIGNAVKYSRESGEVQLKIMSLDNIVRISVIDYGQGIPEDQLEIIFERFKRAQGVSLRDGDSSSGLGLSIVKMLVDAMGGFITVKSIVGEGSQFSIDLKAVDEQV